MTAIEAPLGALSLQRTATRLINTFLSRIGLTLILIPRSPTTMKNEAKKDKIKTTDQFLPLHRMPWHGTMLDICGIQAAASLGFAATSQTPLLDVAIYLIRISHEGPYI